MRAVLCLGLLCGLSAVPSIGQSVTLSPNSVQKSSSTSPGPPGSPPGSTITTTYYQSTPSGSYSTATTFGS